MAISHSKSKLSVQSLDRGRVSSSLDVSKAKGTSVSSIFKIKKKSSTSGLKLGKSKKLFTSNKTSAAGMKSSITMATARRTFSASNSASQTQKFSISTGKVKVGSQNSTDRASGALESSMDLSSQFSCRSDHSKTSISCSMNIVGRRPFMDLSNCPEVSISRTLPSMELSKPTKSSSTHSKASISRDHVRAGQKLSNELPSQSNSGSDCSQVSISSNVLMVTPKPSGQMRASRTSTVLNISSSPETFLEEQDSFTKTLDSENPVDTSPSLEKSQMMVQESSGEATEVEESLSNLLIESQQRGGKECYTAREAAQSGMMEVEETSEPTDPPTDSEIKEENVSDRSTKLEQEKESLAGHETEARTGCEKETLTGREASPENEICSPPPEDVEGILSFRMKSNACKEWVSSVDAINFSLNRDVFLESVFAYNSVDNMRNKFKFEIYHTNTGKMLLQEIEDKLDETDVPEIGELELQHVLKLESDSTYTAVLETMAQKSFGGTKGMSVSYSSIPDSNRSLIISYTKPSQEQLGRASHTS